VKEWLRLWKNANPILKVNKRLKRFSPRRHGEHGEKFLEWLFPIKWEKEKIERLKYFATSILREESKMLFDGEITERIIGAAIEVHKNLGPGLLESAYEECLYYELVGMDFEVERQKELPIVYKGNKLTAKYRIDLLINRQVMVEIKSCKRLEPIHDAQLLTYLKMSNLRYGLLLNFNVPILKKGLKRILNN
jgi:GxxExxY protein